jgi:hypothetical protein
VVQAPKDLMAFGVGLTTAGVGGIGITMGDLQVLLSILASGSGIILTAATLYWRSKEHKRLTKKRDEDAEND